MQALSRKARMLNLAGIVLTIAAVILLLASLWVMWTSRDARPAWVTWLGGVAVLALEGLADLALFDLLCRGRRKSLRVDRPARLAAIVTPLSPRVSRASLACPNVL